MITTFTDTQEDTGAMELRDELTPEERAYWEASIERDMREIAEGKPQEHYPIEDLRTRMLESLSRLYA